MFCLGQVSYVIWMMPALAILATRGHCVTPTPSTGSTSAPARRATKGPTVRKTWTNAPWVSPRALSPPRCCVPSSAGTCLPRARVLRNLGSLGLPRAPLHSQPLGISPRSVAGIETRGRSACESQSKARPRGRRGERRASIEVALLVLIGPSTRRRERGSRAPWRSMLPPPRPRGRRGRRACPSPRCACLFQPTATPASTRGGA